MSVTLPADILSNTYFFPHTDKLSYSMCHSIHQKIAMMMDENNCRGVHTSIIIFGEGFGVSGGGNPGRSQRMCNVYLHSQNPSMPKIHRSLWMIQTPDLTKNQIVVSDWAMIDIENARWEWNSRVKDYPNTFEVLFRDWPMGNRKYDKGITYEFV